MEWICRDSLPFPKIFEIQQGVAVQTFLFLRPFWKVHSNTLWRDYMSQKYNRIFPKLTFILINFQTTFSNFEEDFSEAIFMFCKGFSSYYYVSLWELALFWISKIIDERVFWKTSLMECIPWGNRLKWNLPIILSKVNKFELSLSTLICQ